MAIGTVVTYAGESAAPPDSHEASTRREIAQRLAALKGVAFGGEFDPGRRYERPLYSVPGETLIRGEITEALEIAGEGDFFGGAVRTVHHASKAITHPLMPGATATPADWPAAFAAQVRRVALGGYTAFAREDVRRAAREMLRTGPVRLKQVNARGGRGQAVATSPGECEDFLKDVDDTALQTFGLVLEEHIEEVTTYSVGKIAVDDLLVTYCGTQSLTRANDGAEVYGGSSLLVVRGDFDVLLARDLNPDYREAVEKARLYDAAADAWLPGFLASRRNYDVATGTGSDGRRRCGVLEQSWRMGGASGAEVAALEAFRADPSRDSVSSRCVEIYGDLVDLPPQAVLYYKGTDPKAGYLTKYTTACAADEG